MEQRVGAAAVVRTRDLVYKSCGNESIYDAACPAFIEPKPVSQLQQRQVPRPPDFREAQALRPRRTTTTGGTLPLGIGIQPCNFTQGGISGRFHGKYCLIFCCV